MMLLAVAVVIALLQALMVGAFLWQRRCRRIADEEAALRRSELARAGRFALAGELSGSIAHEVGQPLGAILSNADAAGMMLEDEWRIGELHSILADIRRDALRANQVVQGLRALLQKHTPMLGEIDLNETLDEALTLVRLESRQRRISIESNLLAGSAQVCGDTVQLQQVLLNLTINAMDAMENTGDPDRIMTVTTRTAGQGYEFAVEDRGHGIPPEAKARLFDSLYTPPSRTVWDSGFPSSARLWWRTAALFTLYRAKAAAVCSRSGCHRQSRAFRQKLITALHGQASFPTLRRKEDVRDYSS